LLKKSLFRCTPKNSILVRTANRHKISFLYEKETFLEDDFKSKIWHPDFYLPDFKMCVEYFKTPNNE
tara:strand:- start:731 stop:931 length:201 start_codon:yes stop_codon:yes gene_type:complete